MISGFQSARLKGDVGSQTIERFCQRLHGIVSFHLDPRVAGRIALREIVDEIADALWRRAVSHCCSSERSLFLCLRSTTMAMLDRIQQEYLGCPNLGPATAKLRLTSLPVASVEELANALLGLFSSNTLDAPPLPVQQLQLQQAFNRLDPKQREILAMRHFEQLTREEIAAVLGLPMADVGVRYMHALACLRHELGCTSSSLFQSYCHAG